MGKNNEALKITTEMTVQEIFENKAVREIEKEILSLYYDVERGKIRGDAEVLAIRTLLELRMDLLNGMFEMNQEYKLLLYEFNEALSSQMIEMRKRAITFYQTLKSANIQDDFEVEGRCFLGYGYSAIHPVQTVRAKKIWAILNGCLANYNPLYDDNGAGTFRISSRDEGIDSVNQMLYYSEEEDNFNEGLDRMMTSDMYLIFPFHDLYDHMSFSIFDLLWVRDFNIEIKIEMDYHTYKADDYCDDLDWNKCDFYD